MKFCGGVSVLMEGEGGLCHAWAGSGLKPEHCLFTQCTILSHNLSAEDSSCICLEADSSKATGLRAAAGRVNGGQQGQLGPNSAGLRLLKTRMNMRRQQRRRKGDTRAVRMRCMSNTYVFIIQH